MNNSTIEKLLDISAPWSVLESHYNDIERTLDVRVGLGRGGWFGGRRGALSVPLPAPEAVQTRTWYHLGLAGRRVRIRLEYPLGSRLPNLPWTGPEDSPLSEAVAQRLLILFGSGVSLAAASMALDLDPKEVWRFKHRLDTGKLGTPLSPAELSEYGLPEAASAPLATPAPMPTPVPAPMPAADVAQAVAAPALPAAVPAPAPTPAPVESTPAPPAVEGAPRRTAGRAAPAEAPAAAAKPARGGKPAKTRAEPTGAAGGVPDAANAIWQDLLASELPVDIAHLGFRLNLGRLRAQFAIADEADQRRRAALELHRFCESLLPLAPQEIATLRELAQ